MCPTVVYHRNYLRWLTQSKRGTGKLPPTSAHYTESSTLTFTSHSEVLSSQPSGTLTGGRGGRESLRLSTSDEENRTTTYSPTLRVPGRLGTTCTAYSSYSWKSQHLKVTDPDR